ncbi:MAG: hypothetical protein K9N52_10805 [Verrucomicrobia bacterium]|nr:hypothetical protein [Verrucomicrobiota bacterium]
MENATKIHAYTLSETRKSMVEACTRICQLLGLPRSTGQIFGLLYLSPTPLSLNDIVEFLGISKASASYGTRRLLSWRAIKTVWKPGDRRDYFEVIDDISGLIKRMLNDFIKPRLGSSGKRVHDMLEGLEEEKDRGELLDAEYQICLDRLNSLVRLQEKLSAVIPVADRFV